MEISNIIEYINLKKDATIREIENMCDQAIKYYFSSICVLPYYVPLVKELVKDSNIDVNTIIGYENGLSTITTKSYEAIEVVGNGANGIILFTNISAFKNKDYKYVKDEIEEIRDSIDGRELTVMVDLDEIDDKELIKFVEICNETFINYIQVYSSSGNLDIDKLEIIEKNKSEVLEIKVNIDTINIEKYMELNISKICTDKAIEIMKDVK